MVYQRHPQQARFGPPADKDPSEQAIYWQGVIAAELTKALEKNGSQYFWVGKELAQVLMETDTPEECTALDLPMPGAIVLMLPLGLIEMDNGQSIEWVAIGKTPNGQQGTQRVIAAWGVVSGALMCSHVPGEELLSESFRNREVMGAGGQAKNAEQSRIADSVMALAVNVLLYIDYKGTDADDVTSQIHTTGKPHQVKPPQAHETKPDAFWAPKWIGKNYTAPKEPLGGAHASPRLHPRRKHWRNQRYGTGRAQVKRILIDLVWVGAVKSDE